jgi:hypothetical protein
MSTTKRIMAQRKDGPGMEYRDFRVVTLGYGADADAALYFIGHDDPVAATLDSNTAARWLMWTGAGHARRKDLITVAAHSPGAGWNTDIFKAAVEFLRDHDVLVRGVNA